MFRIFGKYVFFALLLTILTSCGKSPREEKTAEVPAKKPVEETVEELSGEPHPLSWGDIKAEGDTLLAKKDYLGAIEKYRSAAPDMRHAEGVEEGISDAVYNVREIANRDSKSETGKIDVLIKQGKLAEARALLGEAGKRFPESEFPYETRRLKDKSKECLMAEWKLNSEIFVIEKNAKEEDIKEKYGIKFDKDNLLAAENNVKYFYRLNDNLLQAVLNADGKSEAETIEYTFNVPMKPRNTSGFTGLEFYIEVPNNAKVTIDVKCGGIRYQKVLDNPNGAVNIPFEGENGFACIEETDETRSYVDSIAFHVTFDRNPDDDSTYIFSIGEIRLGGRQEYHAPPSYSQEQGQGTQSRVLRGKLPKLTKIRSTWYLLPTSCFLLLVFRSRYPAFKRYSLMEHDRYYIDGAPEGEECILSLEESHHLTHVRRAGPGAQQLRFSTAREANTSRRSSTTTRAERRSG